MSAHETALGPGREFDVIRSLVRQWGDLAIGIGDDAATLDVPHGERLIVTTDASVEDVHFRRDWMTPREIGYRATAAAVSDLAAMAARPLGMVVALSIPTSWREAVLEIGEGIGDCARLCAVPIIGGDTSQSNELSLTITVLGAAARPLERRGAHPGDRVYVTGQLGGPRLALDRLLDGEAPEPAHRERFVHPVPRLQEARWLADRGATAAIDISDGLVSDLGHIAAASGVDVLVDLERLPLVESASARDAASSGEEYELAVTASLAFDAAEFARTFGVALTLIGEVRATEGAPAFRARQAGAFVDLARGYDHFSS